MSNTHNLPIPGKDHVNRTNYQPVMPNPHSYIMKNDMQPGMVKPPPNYQHFPPLNSIIPLMNIPRLRESHHQPPIDEVLKNLSNRFRDWQAKGSQLTVDQQVSLLTAFNFTESEIPKIIGENNYKKENLANAVNQATYLPNPLNQPILPHPIQQANNGGLVFVDYKSVPEGGAAFLPAAMNYQNQTSVIKKKLDPETCVNKLQTLKGLKTSLEDLKKNQEKQTQMLNNLLSSDLPNFSASVHEGGELEINNLFCIFINGNYLTLGFTKFNSIYKHLVKNNVAPREVIDISSPGNENSDEERSKKSRTPTPISIAPKSSISPSAQDSLFIIQEIFSASDKNSKKRKSPGGSKKPKSKRKKLSPPPQVENSNNVKLRRSTRIRKPILFQDDQPIESSDVSEAEEVEAEAEPEIPQHKVILTSPLKEPEDYVTIQDEGRTDAIVNTLKIEPEQDVNNIDEDLVTMDCSSMEDAVIEFLSRNILVKDPNLEDALGNYFFSL